jgi:hypothetical protein
MQAQQGESVCPMCQKPINPMFIFSHIPTCYRNFCKLQNIEPLCTCDLCEAKHSHHYDAPAILHAKKEPEEKREPPPLLNDRPLKQPKLEEKAESKFPKLTLDAFVGKRCMVCTTKKSPSAMKTVYPYLNVGQFISFMIHKKEHLAEPSTAEHIVAIVDQELTRIREKGDSALTGKISSSPEKKEEEEEEEAERHPCCGYHDEDKEVRCTETTDNKLWIETTEGKKYFCKAVHLVRYLRVGNARGSTYVGTQPVGQVKKEKKKEKKKGKTQKKSCS